MSCRAAPGQELRTQRRRRWRMAAREVRCPRLCNGRLAPATCSSARSLVCAQHERHSECFVRAEPPAAAQRRARRRRARRHHVGGPEHPLPAGTAAVLAGFSTAPTRGQLDLRRRGRRPGQLRRPGGRHDGTRRRSRGRAERASGPRARRPRRAAHRSAQVRVGGHHALRARDGDQGRGGRRPGAAPAPRSRPVRRRKSRDRGGAGVRLRDTSAASNIARALRRLLVDESFAQGARALWARHVGRRHGRQSDRRARSAPVPLALRRTRRAQGPQDRMTAAQKRWAVPSRQAGSQRRNSEHGRSAQHDGPDGPAGYRQPTGLASYPPRSASPGWCAPGDGLRRRAT